MHFDNIKNKLFFTFHDILKKKYRMIDCLIMINYDMNF